MRWPRGRYNGRRIVGLFIKVRLDVTWWRVGLGSVLLGACFSFGPVHLWVEPAYDERYAPVERRDRS